jgi:hypothetical protein
LKPVLLLGGNGPISHRRFLSRLVRCPIASIVHGTILCYASREFPPTRSSMAVIFQDVLDTVRTSHTRLQSDSHGAGIAHLHAKGSMLLYALLGHQLRISQSHAFDSSVILDCCLDSTAEEAAAFLALVEKGQFQVGLRDKSLLDALRSNLDKMELSAWPEVDRPEVRDAQNRVVQPAGPLRTELIHYVNSGAGGQALPDSVKAKVEAVRRLDAALRNSPVQPRAANVAQEFQLQAFIADYFERAQATVSEPPQIVAALEALDSLKTNGRSAHYARIRELDLPQDDKAYLMSIVDIGYNRVISRSLETRQVVLTAEQPKALRSVAEPDPSIQFIGLSPAKAFPHLSTCSWDNLLRFLTSVAALPPEDQKREAEVAKFLARIESEHGLWAVLPRISPFVVELLLEWIPDVVANAASEGLVGIPASDILPSCYLQGAKDTLERLLDPFEAKAEPLLPQGMVPAMKKAFEAVREPAEKVKGVLEHGERRILARRHRGVLASFRVDQ